jgi:hypothetical protein
MKDTALLENSRVVAGLRQGNGMGTAWYVLIGLKCPTYVEEPLMIGGVEYREI